MHRSYRRHVHAIATEVTERLCGTRPNACGDEWVPEGLGPDAPMTAAQRLSVGSRVSDAIATDDGRSPKTGPSTAVFAKCLIAAHSVLVGRWDLVPAHEREALHRVLTKVGVTRPPPPPEPPFGRHDVVDGGVVVDFAVPWRPRRHQGRVAVATGRVLVPEVRLADAPVACTLLTPGPRLAVRRHGDGFLRPVLAPGSWRPATVAEFAAAARDGTPWRDDPFRMPPTRGRPVLSLLDVADPTPVTWSGNAAASERVVRAATERAAGLRVIDGIVHRPCGTPTFGVLATRSGHPTRRAATWRLDGLHGLSTMDTLVGAEPEEVSWLGQGGVTEGDAGPRPYDVPVQEWAEVVEALGVVRPPIASTRRFAAPVVTGPPVEDVARFLLPPSPDAVPDAAAWALRHTGEVDDADVMARWHELLPLLDGLGADGLRAACEGLVGACARSGADVFRVAFPAALLGVALRRGATDDEDDLASFEP